MIGEMMGDLLGLPGLHKDWSESIQVLVPDIEIQREGQRLDNRLFEVLWVPGDVYQQVGDPTCWSEIHVHARSM